MDFLYRSSQCPRLQPDLAIRKFLPPPATRPPPKLEANRTQLAYTLDCVYPALAMVEDENPPAYEPVALGEDAPNAAHANVAAVANADGKPITSSIRATDRLLGSTGGILARFRGFFVLLVTKLFTGILASIFAGVLGNVFTPLATLLAVLTMVQFSTAWLHIVISHPKDVSNWKRLPLFKRTFDATWKPTLIYWVTFEITRWTPTVLGLVFDCQGPTLVEGKDGLHWQTRDGDAWKSIVILLIAAFVELAIVIPSKMVLFRIQASLLPEDDDPIVPFDRSFQGQVDPAVVDGKGYATLAVAWSSVTRSAWRRIIILHAKIFAITFAVTTVFSLILIPQVYFIMERVDKGGDEL